jgi:saccharopine dehydrogenase-like NADP-dependent oxidoreductase
MNLQKDKILIVGGYGNVGTAVSKILAKKFPAKIIIAGRNIEKGQKLIDELNLKAKAVKLNLNTEDFNEISFEEIHTVINCVEFLKNSRLIHKCIQFKINYTELATSFEAYNRLLKFIKEFEDAGTCLVPGVGLMPGISGIFVQNAISRLKQISKVQSYVLLGLGENHGLDAIRWMMDNATKSYSLKTENGMKQVYPFSKPVKMQLLNEKKGRNFYPFNFGDQHIIVKTNQAEFAQTYVAFDSRFTTGLIAVSQKAGLLKGLSKIKPKSIKKWLAKFRIGTEKFTVQTHCQGVNKNEIIYSAEGYNEANATGVIAVYAVLQLYPFSNNTGMKHLEDIVEYEDFIQFLNDFKINIRYKES